MRFTKYILPVVVGAMAAMMLMTLGEYFIGKQYHLPADIDTSNKNLLEAAIRDMPAAAFVSLLVNYAIASFIGGLAAALVAGRIAMRPSIIVGIVLTLAGLFNVLSLKHPLWFTIVNLFIYVPFAYFGYLVVRKRAADPNIG
jgi:hypothetical protein